MLTWAALIDGSGRDAEEEKKEGGRKDGERGQVRWKG